MIKKYRLLTTIIGFSIGTAAFSHEANPILQATMKAIAQDVQTISLPAKKPTPGDVTDGMILAGIARARTGQIQLQLVIDKKDTGFCRPSSRNLQRKIQKKQSNCFRNILTI